MLNKSIRFNYKLVDNEFMSLIFITISTFILSFINGGIGGSLITIVLTGATLIISIFMYIKLFKKSLFGDEANTYMTIPISMRDMILGKIIIVGLLNVATWAITLVGTYLMMQYLKSGSFDDTILDSIFGNFIKVSMSPIEGAIVGFFFITKEIIVVVAGALFVLTIQVIIHQNSRMKKETGFSDIMIFVSFVAGGAVVKAMDYCIYEIYLKGINYTALFFIEIIILILIGFGLYKFCLKKLTYEYDLK